MSMQGKPIPNPIPLYRIIHVETLPTLLSRGALHAPNSTPQDGLPYRTIHSVSVQASRHRNQIGCGPRGTCHEYVPFYFGPLSVMLLNLKTGRVNGYNEGQEPLVYLRGGNTVPGTLTGKGQIGNRELALGDGRARGSEGVGRRSRGSGMNSR